jgi:hypothetical protein
MGDVVFTFDVDARPETIRQALTTTEGITSFWTDEAEVPAEVGERLKLGFPDAPAAFDLVLTGSDDDVISWRRASRRNGSEPTSDGRSQAATRLRQSPSVTAPSAMKQSRARLVLLKQYAETGVAAPVFVN